ncbi:hypothetical protein HD553DRAFT_325085 [Filobasidium floriforme]|uniref:uncharacterized protein n=1 Tax=Filobasidium floriforme TaxID=5210 RepID=UPI001E8EC764|nr:uncharacterized protein HD553DRAFT_325085 [Filobasidium floriforme]KAH8082227.1 hypothetical protein HD553DRAFT_325085 [Filobasidium floriforme]
MHLTNAKQASVVSKVQAQIIAVDIRAEVEATLFEHRGTSAAIASLWVNSGKPMHEKGLESYIPLLPAQWIPEPHDDARRWLDRHLLLQVAKRLVEKLTKRKAAAAKKKEFRLQDRKRAEYASNTFEDHQRSYSGLEIASSGHLTQLRVGGSSVYDDGIEEIDDAAPGPSQFLDPVSQHDSKTGEPENSYGKRREAAADEIRRIVNEIGLLRFVFFLTYDTKFEFFVQLRGFLEAGNSLPSFVNVNPRPWNNRAGVYMKMAGGLISSAVPAADGLQLKVAQLIHLKYEQMAGTDFKIFREHYEYEQKYNLLRLQQSDNGESLLQTVPGVEASGQSDQQIHKSTERSTFPEADSVTSACTSITVNSAATYQL